MEKNGRSYQQNLVYDRLVEGLKAVQSANESLESRANKIIGGSAGAVGILVGFNLLPKAIVATSHIESWVLVLLCASQLGIFWFASNLWAPMKQTVTGNSDLRMLYDDFISVPEDIAYNHALTDLADAFEKSVKTNAAIASDVQWMMRILKLQFVLLALGVVVKVWVAGV